jgi:hypothetical protein
MITKNGRLGIVFKDIRVQNEPKDPFIQLRISFYDLKSKRKFILMANLGKEANQIQLAHMFRLIADRIENKYSLENLDRPQIGPKSQKDHNS